MNKKLKPQSIITIIFGVSSLVILIQFGKSFKSTYELSDQKTQLSYTTIENVKKDSKLVTAKKQLDFITIMDGKDGRYLGISTYEVKSGIDFGKVQTGKFQIEIFSSDIIHNLQYRTEAEKKQSAEDFRNQINPLEKAYRQKAVDYAIEYGILDQAKEQAESLFKQFNIPLKTEKNQGMEIIIPETKQAIKLPFLPLKLEIADNHLNDDSVFLEQFENIQIKSQPVNQFNRDSLILRNDIMNWEIRIGDTGMSINEIKGTFADVFKNVLKTNANSDNKGKDNVQLFRYFDPLYHKKIEVFSYASDYYRTFFLAYDGRIYYLDAGDKISEQTLIDYVSPIMVYLATSIRPITDEKTDFVEEYKTYTSNYYEASRNLRDEFKEKRTRFELGVDKLINSNILEEDGNLTQEEKYFAAFSDIEMFGRDEKNNDIILTGSKPIDEKISLYKSLRAADDFNTVEKRDYYVKQADSFSDSIVGEYLRAYFIQNILKYNIQEDEKAKFVNDMNNGTKIASRILIAEKDDTQRNEYFRNIFRTRFSESLAEKDTTSKISDKEESSTRLGDNLLFYYYDLPELSDHHTDGEIYERMKKMNNNTDISNAFVLVFNTKQFDFGILDENDIHAIVFDDATMRFFPNVASLNVFEKAGEVINDITKRYTKLANDILDTDIGSYLKFLNPHLMYLSYGIEKYDESSNKNNKFFYYGDWKHLTVDPKGLKLNKVSIGEIKLTKKGKNSYRDTNDYAQKSVIASVINDLQHSYSAEESNYYYDELCNMIKATIRNEMYKEIFRPSPRMIVEYSSDNNRRNNF